MDEERLVKCELIVGPKGPWSLDERNQRRSIRVPLLYRAIHPRNFALY